MPQNSISCYIDQTIQQKSNFRLGKLLNLEDAELIQSLLDSCADQAKEMQCSDVEKTDQAKEMQCSDVEKILR